MSRGSDPPGESTQEDADLKMLHARRMVELRKRMNSNLAKKAEAEKLAQSPKKPTDRETVMKSLVDRGDEVLLSAESSYPSETALLIPQLAKLIREGKVNSISGGELLQFFRSIGMRVSVNTSISVQEHGRFVSLSEKLKQND
jgi:DNA-binding TFAR19-related protein (PDSD5 family)